ncbi:hypothetical protein SAMN02745220_01180 [Desulfopila aestuarii DSM 18488]|uniref:Uncharacterized protein n=1 Tax=Desulfopila aestuarii DSM 18488 TaxID=1121416 RepID=A0A1M7Y1P0_9BACT|nr:hypothetical protein SAMN02745220_01180 [Desulfopila aestuarii DSM 18488]
MEPEKTSRAEKLARKGPIIPRGKAPVVEINTNDSYSTSYKFCILYFILLNF